MRSQNKEVVAIYPGSFDPVTLGHEDIARRTLRLADRLLIAVAEAATQAKEGLFTVEERLDLLREIFEGQDRVECVSFSGLLMDFAKSRNAHCVIRGLRAVSDFEYEFQMALTNRKLAPKIETIFMMTADEFAPVSSRFIKEIARLDGDTLDFVTPYVKKQLKKKNGKKR